MLDFLFANTLTFLNFYCFFRNFFQVKQNKLKTFFVYCISVISLTIINMFGVNHFNFIFVLLVYCIFINLEAIANYKHKLFMVIIFSIITIISEIISINILNVVANFTLDTFENYYIIAVIQLNILIFIICKITHYIFKTFIHADRVFKLPPYAWIIFILPITTMLLMLNIVDYYHLFRHNRLLFFSMIGLVISNIVVLFIFFNVVSLLSYKHKYALVTQEEKNNRNTYKLLKDNYNSSFDFTHDTLNKTVEIQNYLEKKEYSSAKEKLNILINKTFKHFNLLFSNSIIVNALISKNEYAINKYNINLKTTIEHNDFSFLDGMDEYILFDLLFSIAIDTSINHTAIKNFILRSKKINDDIIIQLIVPTFNTTNSVITNHLNELEELCSKYKTEVNYNKEDSKDYTNITIAFSV